MSTMGSRSWRSVASTLVACTVVASLAATARAQGTAADPDAGLPVVEVTGDDVNLRCGPSIDHHDVGQVSRGQLLLELARDGEFVRVRVPGGVPVYVFATLLAWDEEGGALRCTVAADDVLLRATPTTAHYPLHDQKLQRGTELVVLSAEESERGRWLRVVTPRDVHVWVHERYVRSVDPRPAADVLRKAAQARLDELSGGRTRAERERLEATRRAQLEARLAALAAKVDDGACDAELEAAARALAVDCDDEPLRVRALALAERMVGAREAREQERLRSAEETARRQAEEARRRQAELEEQRRRREAEIEAERKRQALDRGTPAAAGLVRARGELVWLEADGGVRVDVTSRKFRLADYRGRNVRVWGHRRQRRGERDIVEVTSIEIVGD